MYKWKCKIRKKSDMIDYLRKEINGLNKISYRLKQRKRNPRCYSQIVRAENNRNHFLVSAKLTVLYYVLFTLTNPNAVSNPHDSFVLHCDNKVIRSYIRKVGRVCCLCCNQSCLFK